MRYQPKHRQGPYIWQHPCPVCGKGVNRMQKKITSRELAGHDRGCLQAWIDVL